MVAFLDTNVITKMLDKDPVAIRMVEKTERPCTSIIVAGELYYAALKSGRPEANLKIFREVISNIEVIFIDDVVTLSYGKIKTALKKKGTPIPDNDIWIAACAMVHGLSIATFDGHFSEIPELNLVPVD